jgi:hypothetical protein
LGDIDVDGKLIILKWILKKQGMSMWIGFKLVQLIGSGGGLL